MMVLKLKLESVSSVLKVRPFSKSTGKDQRYNFNSKDPLLIHHPLASTNVKYLLYFFDACEKNWIPFHTSIV